MSDSAFHDVEETGRRLVALTRASRSFASLRDGSASLTLYREWLVQTALYCGITGEVLAVAADSLSRAEEPLARWAGAFAAHGIEEGEENPVILEDLAFLGIDLNGRQPIPPVATYLVMARAMAFDTQWAIGLFGLVRTLEILAADCAGTLYENLGRSTFPEIRGALRFINAHRDEVDHLARTETVIRAVPARYDPMIVWCARLTCQIYDGLLAHLDDARPEINPL